MSTMSAAQAWIKAKDALEEAKKIKAQADALLKEAYAKAGVTFEVVDGVKISLIEGTRTSYDSEALAGLVSAPVYKMVTKPVIDSEMFEAAVKTGKIKPEVAQAVTSETSYTQIKPYKIKAGSSVVESSEAVAS